MPYADGTCRSCGDEPEPGRTRCARCAARRRRDAAALRAARRRAGLCLTCGAKAVRDRAYCAAHLEAYRARARGEPGLCVTCGAATEGDAVRCAYHQELRREAQRRRRAAE